MWNFFLVEPHSSPFSHLFIGSPRPEIPIGPLSDRGSLTHLKGSQLLRKMNTSTHEHMDKFFTAAVASAFAHASADKSCEGG